MTLQNRIFRAGATTILNCVWFAQERRGRYFAMGDTHLNLMVIPHHYMVLVVDWGAHIDIVRMLHVLWFWSVRHAESSHIGFRWPWCSASVMNIVGMEEFSRAWRL
jgi:hypothetical protein